MARQPPVGQGLKTLPSFQDRTQALHTRYDSCRRVISPSQKPLLDNTRHSQETDFSATGGIRSPNPSKREAAGPNLDRAATGTSKAI